MRLVLGFLTRLVVLAVFAALLVGGSLLLRWPSQTDDLTAQQADTILPVSVRIVGWEDGYTVTDRFVGRLEPAREARLGFERGGLITEVLVEEGDAVQTGTVLALLDASLLEAERDRLAAQRAQAVAGLELARLTADRQRALAGQGHASSQRFDEARLNAEVAVAELASIDAALRRVDLDLNKSALFSPFDGTVGARHVDPGVVVSAGTGVVDVLETARPQARIGVSPQGAATLSVGQTIPLSVAGAEVVGTIAAIRPDLSPETRTTTVLIDLPAPSPGMFGDTVTLALQRPIQEPGIWVPVASLLEGERGLWSVLIALAAQGPRSSAVVGQAVVEVLHADGDRVYVRGTLRDGDRLIEAGPHRIVPGQTVAIVEGQG